MPNTLFIKVLAVSLAEGADNTTNGCAIHAYNSRDGYYEGGFDSVEAIKKAYPTKQQLIDYIISQAEFAGAADPRCVYVSGIEYHEEELEAETAVGQRGFASMIGKTIKAIDTKAMNCVGVQFTDGTVVVIDTESGHYGIAAVVALSSKGYPDFDFN